MGYGCYRVFEEDTFYEALRRGYRYFDTAEAYRNEEKLVSAILRYRPSEKILISTKIHYRCGGSKEAITRSFHRRMEIWNAVGGIDLLLLHKPSTDCRGDWETLCALQRRYPNAVRAVGVCNYEEGHLEEIMGVGVIPAVNQIEFHPFFVRKGLVDYCRERGIVVVAHTPLVRAEKASHPVVTAIAGRYGVSWARLLLSWARLNGLVVIPRAVTVEHIEENLLEHPVQIEKEDMELFGQLDEGYRITIFS